MRMLKFPALALVLALFAGSPAAADAQLGVGISHAEIVLQEKVEKGGRYQLPAVTVSNTGSVPSRYQVVVSFIQGQEQMRPDPSWFRFEPQAFELEPGQRQAVAIFLNVGASAEPGEYFALVEAHPIQDDAGVAVGVAAATKLSFEVEPSSVFELWRLRIAHFFEDNSPFSLVLPPLLAALALVYLASRRFRLRVERRR
jgi:P pilus assembly chaperone PapD